MAPTVTNMLLICTFKRSLFQDRANFPTVPHSSDKRSPSFQAKPKSIFRSTEELNSVRSSSGVLLAQCLVLDLIIISPLF